MYKFSNFLKSIIFLLCILSTIQMKNEDFMLFVDRNYDHVEVVVNMVKEIRNYPEFELSNIFLTFYQFKDTFEVKFSNVDFVNISNEKENNLRSKYKKARKTNDSIDIEALINKIKLKTEDVKILWIFSDFFFNTSSNFKYLQSKDFDDYMWKTVHARLIQLIAFIGFNKRSIHFFLASEDILASELTQIKEIKDIGKFDHLLESTLNNTYFTKKMKNAYTLIKKSNLLWLEKNDDNSLSYIEKEDGSIDENILSDSIIKYLENTKELGHVDICILFMTFLQRDCTTKENQNIESLFYQKNFPFCYPFKSEIIHKNDNLKLCAKHIKGLKTNEKLTNTDLKELINIIKNNLKDNLFIKKKIKLVSDAGNILKDLILSLDQIVDIFTCFPSIFIENVRFSRIMSIIFAIFCHENCLIFKDMAIQYLEFCGLDPNEYKINNIEEYNAVVMKLKSHTFPVIEKDEACEQMQC